MSDIWHKLKKLAINEFKSIPTNSGVYYLRWSKDNKPVHVARLYGLDIEGILYIGSARNLKQRIKNLWKAVNGKINAHTIGKTIKFCGVDEIADLEDYEIKWTKSAVGKEIIDEWKAIHSYSMKFKEPPPLNLALRRKMFAIWDLGVWGHSRWTD